MKYNKQIKRIIKSILIVMSIGMLLMFLLNYNTSSYTNHYYNIYENIIYRKKCSNDSVHHIVQPLTIKALEVAPKDIVTDYNNKREEKFDISVTPINFLVIKHSNACFDFHTNITMDAYIENDTIIVLNEHGTYGREGVYRYFTISSIIGPIYKGKYCVVVERNNNPRSNFNIKLK